MIFIASCMSVYACDACGCSIMGNPAGLLTQYKKNYLSLGWIRSGFNTVPGVGEESVDVFHSFDISFQYYLSSRWRVGLYQPYRLNTREVNEIDQSVIGFGDTRLTADFTFYKKTTSDDFEIYLDLGTGLSLPTGKYDPHLHDQDLPENFNPGNGSIGMSVQQTSSVSLQSFGVVLKNSWTHYLKNNADYTFGDQWGGNLLLFYNLPVDSVFSILPMGGFQLEKVNADLHPNGTVVDGTGGEGTFISAGCQVKLNNWLCTFQYLVPLTDHYSSGDVEASQRFNLQLTHLF
jgi:hypothetical protein